MLTDPRLAKPLAAIKLQIEELEDLAALAEDWNDPRTSVEKVGSGGKPSSREPGRPQCEAFIKRLAEILEDTAKKTQRARPMLQEMRAEIVRSIGGIPIKEPTSSKVMHEIRVARRNGTTVPIVKTVTKEPCAAAKSQVP